MRLTACCRLLMLWDSRLCAGNPDPEFTELIEKHGATLCGPKGQVVCVLDCTGEVTNHDGRVHGRTVRRSYCEVLFGAGGRASSTVRCKSCVKYLRSMEYRLKSSNPAINVAHDSHTSYIKLKLNGFAIFRNRRENWEIAFGTYNTEHNHLLQKRELHSQKLNHQIWIHYWQMFLKRSMESFLKIHFSIFYTARDQKLEPVSQINRHPGSNNPRILEGQSIDNRVYYLWSKVAPPFQFS